MTSFLLYDFGVLFVSLISQVSIFMNSSINGILSRFISADIPILSDLMGMVFDFFRLFGWDMDMTILEIILGPGIVLLLSYKLVSFLFDLFS